jgi:hypothetical protein
MMELVFHCCSRFHLPHVFTIISNFKYASLIPVSTYLDPIFRENIYTAHGMPGLIVSPDNKKKTCASATKL